MTEPDEIARFHDRCSPLMRELLDGLVAAPDHPRPFPAIEDAIGWPRRRIASVLGGVARLRQMEFDGRRPYRFLSERESPSGRWEMWMDADQAEAVLAATEPAAPERAAPDPADAGGADGPAADAAAADAPAADASAAGIGARAGARGKPLRSR